MFKMRFRCIGVSGLENKLKIELAVVQGHNPCAKRIGSKPSQIDPFDFRLKES